MGIPQCYLYTNRCLRKILKFSWSDVTSDEEMWRCAREKSVAIQVKLQKWKWTGHKLRKNSSAREKMVLSWNPPPPKDNVEGAAGGE
jgi:hypothetical protein